MAFLPCTPSTPGGGGLVAVDYAEVTTDKGPPGILIASGSVAVGGPGEVYLLQYSVPDVLYTGGVCNIICLVSGVHAGIFGVAEWIPLAEVQASMTFWRRLTGLAAGATTFSLFATSAGGGGTTFRAGDGTGDNLSPAFLYTWLVT